MRICSLAILLSMLNPFAGAVPSTTCQSLFMELVCTQITLEVEGLSCRDIRLWDLALPVSRYIKSVGHFVSFCVDNSFNYNFLFTFRLSCFQLMMSFLECASSWLASNHLATRAFEPSESLDHLQHPTFRHLIPVSTGNLWLFTALVFLRSGSCGTSCTTLNWAVIIGPAHHLGPLSGRAELEKRTEKKQTTAGSRCLWHISDSLQGPVGSARAPGNTK